MTKRKLTLFALFMIVGPIAPAGAREILKSHEPISFNALISQNDADAQALHDQFSRHPDAVDETQDDDNVESAPSAPDTASNDN